MCILFACILGCGSLYHWWFISDLIAKHGIKVNVCGELTLLPKDVYEAANRLMDMTSKHDKWVLSIVFSVSICPQTLTEPPWTSASRIPLVKKWPMLFPKLSLTFALSPMTHPHPALSYHPCLTKSSTSHPIWIFSSALRAKSDCLIFSCGKRVMTVWLPFLPSYGLISAFGPHCLFYWCINIVI